MKISAFKEILLKKSKHDVELNSFIENSSKDCILDIVLESLEKMARPSQNMGRNANSAITTFASSLKNRDINMMRDALGHHISHHKAELKAGNRAAADAHLNKIIPLMHLIAKARSHSGGKLDMDYIPLEPWESNYTTLERNPSGLLQEGTKGLGRRPKRTDRSRNPRGVPDYRYLEMPPHSGHADMKSSLHSDKGYPFEEIQVGNPSAIDSSQAFLHIRDVQPTGTFKPHPFDHHPIHRFADLKQSDISHEMQNNFARDLDSWINHDSSKKWNEDIKALYDSNPEEFKNIGKTKPNHHFDGIKLLTQPEEALKHAQVSAEPSARSQQTSSNEDVLLSIADLDPKLKAIIEKQKALSSSSEAVSEKPATQKEKTKVNEVNIPSAIKGNPVLEAIWNKNKKLT